MKQVFVFNDGERVEAEVVGQFSVVYDSMTVQMSKILWYHIDGELQYRYIYEEIDSIDMVVYCHYVQEQTWNKYLAAKSAAEEKG